ncbi:MAG: winged helix-turn-helix transcriptional regulator [Thermoplasmatota archaeon]
MSGLAHKLLLKEELLDNELRMRVMDYLTSNPGSYLGRISKDLAIPTSTLKYHLSILRSFEMVTTVKKGRCRHYFPRRRRFSDEEKSLFAAMEHRPTRRMVELIHHNPGISQSGLVKTTGLSQSTVAWHMAKLEQLGLVTSERNEVKEYRILPQFETILAQAYGQRLLGLTPDIFDVRPWDPSAESESEDDGDGAREAPTLEGAISTVSAGDEERAGWRTADPIENGPLRTSRVSDPEELELAPIDLSISPRRASVAADKTIAREPSRPEDPDEPSEAAES